MRRTRLIPSVLILALVYLLASVAAGAVLADAAMRRNRHPLPQSARAEAEAVAARTGTRLEDVRLQRPDGATLRAWALLQPGSGRPGALALHGMTGTRAHVVGYGALLASAGYSVLLPDARGHGESDGVASYGAREAGDVSAWARWLGETTSAPCIVGVGSSMGAVHLLLALPSTPLAAVVADSAFVSFREAALDRLERHSGLGWLGRQASRPALEAGLLAAWLREDVWMGAIAPGAALAATQAPVLLIHGADDRATPVRHASRLAAARPGTLLWIVPSAGHTGSWNAAGQSYEDRLLAFLATARCGGGLSAADE